MLRSVDFSALPTAKLPLTGLDPVIHVFIRRAFGGK